MDFLEPDLSQKFEIISFFKRVFTESEGESEGLLIGNLVSEIIKTTQDSDLFVFTIIEQNKMLGCVIFSRVIFGNNVNAFILSPMAILTNHQGKGLGQALIKYGLDKLISNDVELVLTYGDINFYSKAGFQKISNKKIRPPFELEYSQGWLGQSLSDKDLSSYAGKVVCVSSLNKKEYW